MDPKLSKDAVRVRRRIMHRITRALTHDDLNKKAAFDKHYKNLVHDAITIVLATENWPSPATRASND